MPHVGSRTYGLKGEEDGFRRTTADTR